MQWMPAKNVETMHEEAHKLCCPTTEYIVSDTVRNKVN